MQDKWSPQEILEIAEKVERHGQSLYELLESKTEDEKLKKVWIFLKEQEIRHQKVFRDMLADDHSFKVKEFGTGEYDAYIEAIASEYIFTPQVIEDKLNAEFGSDLEAVNFALGMEKESVLVYTALKEYVIEDHRHILDKIIDEEKKHVVELIKLKQILKQ
jgi:rubrerythrin